MMQVRSLFSTGRGVVLPSFHHFQFLPQIHSYLEHAEIHTPTYIQYALWCKLMRGKGQGHMQSNTNTSQQVDPNLYHINSSTGSGKTLAYLLPIVQNLCKEEIVSGKLTCSMRPRSLIVTASKEQVLQIRSVGKQISHQCKLKIEGVNIGRTMREERKLIQNGVDILIGTHGRLEGMKERKQYFMSNIKWIVIDQIDTFQSTGKLQSLLKQFITPIVYKRRMIDSGGNPLPQQDTQQAKIILSSTTYPPSLKKLLQNNLPPHTHIISPLTHIPLHNINHQFLHCQTLDKHEQIINLLNQKRNQKIMIFCNTATSLNQLQYYLESRGVRIVGTIHSRLNKMARLNNYQHFRDCKEGVLLSTDLGARGLDFPHLSTVINYDFPLTPTDYLQRSGRTGRAGNKGSVITLYHKKDMPIIQELKKAGFNKQVRVGDSAYSVRNREESGKSKFK